MAPTVTYADGDTVYREGAPADTALLVVTGKLVARDLKEKLGVGSDSVRTNANADAWSVNAPFTEEQRAQVEAEARKEEEMTEAHFQELRAALRPIERYALNFREHVVPVFDQNLAKQRLKAMEQAQTQKWEVEKLEKMKKDEEESTIL